MGKTLALASGLLLGLSAATASAAELFPRPAALEPRVRFWTRIYSEVGTDAGLIHDVDHLEVVYGLVRLPAELSPPARERTVREAKEHYETILRRLARGDRAHLGSEERRVLGLWPPGVSSATLKRAAERVRFQLGQADKFRDGIVRSGAWMHHIASVFAAEGLPLELAVLPHVESSFNPRAYSKAGAAGLWQFTHPTGRRFMRIDSAVDERLDPFRATEAAAALLRENYERTGTWPLAITAYNHGTSGMVRAVHNLGTRDIATIIERHESRTFGFASRNFYTEFLAALDVDRAAERYFGAIERSEPLDHEAVVLDAYYPVRALSRAFGVDLERLNHFNPALRAAVWNGEKHVPRGFALRLPRVADRAPATTLIASISARQRFAQQRPDRTYRVKRGDTLSRIAAHLGVSERELAARNGLRNRHRIRVGQLLHVPGRAGSSGSRVSRSARAAEAAPPPAPPATPYRVQRGDNLSVISRRLGVPASELAAANGLRHPDRLQVGQVIRVPGAEVPEPQERPSQPAKPAAAATLAPQSEARSTDVASGAVSFDATRYAVAPDGRIEVQPEETLGHFAEWLELPASHLRSLNGMSPRHSLAIGRRLRLDFTRVPAAQFEAHRLRFHRELRERFFSRHRIAGTAEHVLRRGETLWELSRDRYGLPIWLLSDFNPDLSLGDLRPGARLRIPRIEPRST